MDEQALQKREEAVRNGKLATIIFVRDFNARGQEISGYIDFGHRLNCKDMDLVFHRMKRLLPKPSDLSTYNWNTQTSYINSTPEFQVGLTYHSYLILLCYRSLQTIEMD